MLIGELAERAGSTSRALRYYEQQGLLQPERTSNGYRVYADDAVLQVRQIRALLAAGFSSSTVAVLLPCATGPEPSIELCPEVAAAMRDTLASIEARIDDQSDHRDRVSALLAR